MQARSCSPHGRWGHAHAALAAHPGTQGAQTSQASEPGLGRTDGFPKWRSRDQRRHTYPGRRGGQVPGDWGHSCGQDPGHIRTGQHQKRAQHQLARASCSTRQGAWVPAQRKGSRAKRGGLRVEEMGRGHWKPACGSRCSLLARTALRWERRRAGATQGQGPKASVTSGLWIRD